jgi:hypothetical protein
VYVVENNLVSGQICPHGSVPDFRAKDTNRISGRHAECFSGFQIEASRMPGTNDRTVLDYAIGQRLSVMRTNILHHEIIRFNPNHQRRDVVYEYAPPLTRLQFVRSNNPFHFLLFPAATNLLSRLAAFYRVNYTKGHRPKLAMDKFVESGRSIRLGKRAKTARFSHLREYAGFPDETPARMAILGDTFVTWRVVSVRWWQ